MQKKKAVIQSRIDRAALQEFARHGIANTAMADIARKAGISVGNVYRYYAGKDDLIAHLLPDSFLEQCRDLLTAKIEAAAQSPVRTAGSLPDVRARHAETLAFLLENRFRILIVFSGERGTPFEDLPQDILDHLVGAVEQYVRTLPTAMTPAIKGERRRLLLQVVYRQLLHGTLAILKASSTPLGLRKALDAYLAYHLGGLANLLQPSG